MLNLGPVTLSNLPLGATVDADRRGTHFRVWAPASEQIEVVLEPEMRHRALTPQPGGYFSGFVPSVPAGQRYRYSIDGTKLVADPASRFQPLGVAGPSEVIDPQAFRWTDAAWQGVGIHGQVIYEMHVGTFTIEGTFQAAISRLPELQRLGITVIEIMPLASFAGRFGWGYDGVFPYAPYEQYGRPEDLGAFIDRAHAIGIAVILDVVYNHLGPAGGIFVDLSPYYLSESKTTDWGKALNFDEARSENVREYFRENAVYWVRDFHFDGLRLDATQDIHDKSARHIIAELIAAARKSVGGRSLIVIAENEPQKSFYVLPENKGGFGVDGLWNDDFHHSAIVALTAQSDAYYSDYRGAPQEFVSALKYGYLYQGQRYRWQKRKRGVPALRPPKSAFVHFIQNHDQIANSASGARVHELTAPGKLRAITALCLLGPATPMLFQGQEYAAPAPFLFFADHSEELASSVRKGRRDFLRQWRSMRDNSLDPFLSEPSDEATFRRCKLNWDDLAKRHKWFDLHHDLLKLRREDEIFSSQAKWGIDGAVLSPSAFVLRFFSKDHENDRLLLINLGTETLLTPLPEPLLAPPLGTEWKILWSSENPKYGGNGVAPLADEGEEGWRLPGNAALVLAPHSQLSMEGR